MHERFRKSARIFVGLTAGLLMLTILRVAQLQVAPGDQLVEVMGSRTTSRVELQGRGSITDRRGRLMAYTEMGYRVYVDASLVWSEGFDPESESDPFERLAINLEELTGLNADTTYLKLTRTLNVDEETDELASRSRYVVLEADASDAMVDALDNHPIRGVVLQKRPIRRYPHGSLAAAIVGRTGPGAPRKQQGRSGIEFARHDLLEPQHGRMEYVRDRRGAPMYVPEDGYSAGSDGETIQLTLDIELQQHAEQLISRAVEAHQAVGGWLIVIEPGTGEVLALADVFRNDVARQRGGWPDGWLDPMRDTAPELARNRTWTDPFEPGSTFKPFFWSWATMIGAARPDEVLDTPGGGYSTSGMIFRDGRRSRRIRDAYGRADQDWSTSLVKSLNTAMAMVAERMDSDDMQSMIQGFGFKAKTGLQVPGEATGLITPPERWDRLYTHLSVSFGQEVAVTPMQLTRAFCVFARPDGTLPLLRVVRTEGSERYLTPALPVLSPEVVMDTRRVLARVMSDQGTGRHARSEFYSIFGKSGTPQMANIHPAPGEKGYFDDRYMPNFLGAAPVEQPRIVVACGLQDPLKGAGANADRNGHGYGGGYSSGRVVRDMIDYSLSYLGVQPDLPQEDD
ncbi:MAG: penicillin-binding protein 2 [Phycisphaerales bacterium]|nr:penicillin-binding protein 2 [Phycisphaerales bacterium]